MNPMTVWRLEGYIELRLREMLVARLGAVLRDRERFHKVSRHPEVRGTLPGSVFGN